MSAWQEFYQAIRGPNWPECATELDFESLPVAIQDECKTVFGYVPGMFRRSSPLPHKVFPIKTETACQLKWNWSTVYLTTGTTSSCHRTHQHQVNTDVFDFHNTPEKIKDREKMLQGQWPDRGCEYCRNIEQAGGQSDRITNLDLVGMHAPIELDSDPTATRVTPRILEIYFDNTCDLKCLYCGPHFSTLWAAENHRHGTFQKGNLTILGTFTKDPNLEANKLKLFQWIEQHHKDITTLNILGGEPLYQSELDEVLELFERNPAPALKLQIFSNLNASEARLVKLVNKVKSLIDREHLREFEVTASLDCWGKAQEYVRYPLSLERWQNNFEYLLDQPWINLIVNSTVTPLTVKTLPDLLEKIKTWNTKRTVYHYQNSVNTPSYMFIDIFGGVFQEDFNRALALKPESTPEERASKQYLHGIAQQSQARGPNVAEIQKLYDFLTEMDRRRRTSWQQTFPWLAAEFEKYSIR